MVTYTATTILDIANNLKNDGITLAMTLGIAGTAIVAIFFFFVERNRTGALKVIAVGLIVVGLISQLPRLGLVSRDTVGQVVNSGGYR